MPPIRMHTAAGAPARARASLGRRALLAALLAVCLVPLTAQRPARAVAAGQPPLTGVLVTASATADDLEAMPDGGLVIRIVVENRSGAALGGLELRAPVPARTRVAEAWQGSPGVNPPAVEASALRWGPSALTEGASSEPFIYRLVPEPGADGATIFRGATLRPVVTWETPARGEAPSPALRLNGLWGDRGARRTVLPGGLTVITVERPESTTVALRLAVRAGSRDEDSVTRGGSHWLEHAFFLGTARRPGNEQVFNAILNLGGTFNGTTGHEYTDYFNSVPADQFDLALDVLADLILNSTFPPDRFDRERRVVAEEIRRAADDPERVADIELYKLLFRVSPIQQDPLGTVESVAAIPIETILAYRAERYVTGNIAIAAAGRIRHDDAVAAIAAAFAPLPRGPRAARPPAPEPVQTQPRRLELGAGRRLAEIRIGWPVAGDDNLDDLAALAILEDILGTTGRRLQRDLGRFDAPAGAYFPSYDVFDDTGAFYINVNTRPDDVNGAVRGVLGIIDDVRARGVSETDVREAIRALIGRRALVGETSLALTGRARGEVAGELESYLEYVARLRSVTPADVQRVARHYLDTTNYTLVVVRS